MLDFLFGGVAEFAGLGAGARERRWRGRPRRRLSAVGAAGKREHVGGVVLAAEVAIQAAQFGIAGDQAVERAALGDLALQAAGEAFDGARGAASAGTRRNVTVLPSGEDMAALRPAERSRRVGASP